MSKIVIDAREYATSTGRYTSKLIEYLEQIDHDNSYVILLKSKDLPACKLTNPNFQKLACDYKEFTFSEQIGFAKQLYSQRADLVHFCMTQQPLLYFKKSVTTIHDLTTARYKNPDKNPAVFFIKQQIYKIVIFYAAYKSKKIITPSNYVKTDLVNYTHIKNSKITVTYEAADPINKSAKTIKSLENKPFIFYVGRPTPHKNLWMLIDAFSSLRAIFPDLLLVLAGKTDRNYQDLKQRVLANHLDNVVFSGFVSEEELKWLYAQAKAYVFPSLSEGFGLPGLEAMVNKTPLISSDKTCLKEIYADAALYFNPTDKISIAEAITAVINNPDIRNKLINKGLGRASQFSWQKMATETLDVYQQALFRAKTP